MLLKTFLVYYSESFIGLSEGTDTNIFQPRSRVANEKDRQTRLICFYFNDEFISHPSCAPLFIADMVEETRILTGKVRPCNALWDRIGQALRGHIRKLWILLDFSPFFFKIILKKLKYVYLLRVLHEAICILIVF